jgi:hypothetical protein
MGLQRELSKTTKAFLRKVLMLNSVLLSSMALNAQVAKFVFQYWTTPCPISGKSPPYSDVLQNGKGVKLVSPMTLYISVNGTTKLCHLNQFKLSKLHITDQCSMIASDCCVLFVP